MPTTPAAQLNNVRLTDLQTKVLHALLKPVGDLTSQKALEARFQQKDANGDPTGEPDHRLTEAIFALWDQKPPLIEESPDLKRHYALTLAGRRLQRQLAQNGPAKAAPKPIDAEDDLEDREEAQKPPTRHKPAKAKGGQTKRADPLAKARAAKAAKKAAALATAPAAQEPADEPGDQRA